MIFQYSDDVIILGNGPSLYDHREYIENLISSGAVVFGVNRIFLSDIRPVHYYVAIDRNCWENHLKEILSLNSLKYFTQKRYCDINFENLYIYTPCSNNRYFSEDLEECISHGYTSVYPCMQMAAMIKPKTIHLFGVDFCARKQTHFFGNRNPNEKSWYNGQVSVIKAIDILNKKNISVEVHSPLFWESANARQLYKSGTNRLR